MTRKELWDKLFYALCKLETRAKVEGQRELLEEIRESSILLYDTEQKEEQLIKRPNIVGGKL